jgi:hypothetical protein
MKHSENRNGFLKAGVWMLGAALFITSCAQIREAAYTGATSAVSDRVEQEVYREVSGLLAGYSSMMLYQLAYTQAFMVGGYMIGTEDFAEGQGATWSLEAGDEDDFVRYTTERALLKRDDDGSSWWYLRYQPEEDSAIEYEIKMNRAMEPLEMYMLNPETGEVEHHTFDFENYQDEYEESYDQLDEDGFETAYYDLDDWEEYKEGTEMLRIGSRDFETTVLFYEGTPEQGDEEGEVRWWLTKEVPGHLVKYEMHDRAGGGVARGEMTDLREDYRPKFADF